VNTVLLGAPLPWQADEWERLRQRIAERRLHHAVLLSGPAGIGKRLLGELLARSVLCRSAERGQACGSCRDCRLAAAGSHPDLLRIAPEEPGKQIRIEQIRGELADFVMRTPGISHAKAVVIDPAEAMNTHTANCLLKSLEEPAPGTHVVLLSDAPARLLPTVRSRCQHLGLRPPPPEVAGEWLRSVCGATDAEDLLGIAAGCPLAALRIRESDGLAGFDRVADVMRRATAPGASVPALVAECSDLDLREALGWVFLFLVDLSRALMASDVSRARIGRAAAMYRETMSRTGPVHVARTLQRTLAARRDASSTANPNRQLLLEALLIDWQGGCAAGDAAGKFAG
jgi:DNA polymerase III subunit delta'